MRASPKPAAPTRLPPETPPSPARTPLGSALVSPPVDRGRARTPAPSRRAGRPSTPRRPGPQSELDPPNSTVVQALVFEQRLELRVAREPEEIRPGGHVFGRRRPGFREGPSSTPRKRARSGVSQAVSASLPPGTRTRANSPTPVRGVLDGGSRSSRRRRRKTSLRMEARGHPPAGSRIRIEASSELDHRLGDVYADGVCSPWAASPAT